MHRFAIWRDVGRLSQQESNRACRGLGMQLPFQCPQPTKTLLNQMLLALTSHFPFSFLMPRQTELWSGSTKRGKLQVEIKTTYWKQQCDKIMNSNSNNIKNRRYKTKKLFAVKKTKTNYQLVPPHHNFPCPEMRKSPAHCKWHEMILCSSRGWPHTLPGYCKKN